MKWIKVILKQFFFSYFSIVIFSKLAVFDGKKAIRGGIPFVFRMYFHLK